MAAVDLQQVIAALRAADKAGNVEEARQLAGIAQKMRTSGGRSPSPGFWQGANLAAGEVFQGFNRQVAKTLDVAGNPVAAGLRKVGVDAPENPVETGFEAMGWTPPPGQPESPLNATGRFLGMGLEAAAPLVRGGQLLAAAPKAVQGGYNTAQKFVRDIFETTVRSPVTAAGVEGMAAFGMAHVGEGAARALPDFPAARMYGETVGGLAGPASLYYPSVWATRKVLQGLPSAIKSLRYHITAGAENRAASRVKRAAREPDEAVAQIGKEHAVEGMTPAQASGDEGLMELENSVLDMTSQLKGRHTKQIDGVTQLIRNAAKEVPGGQASIGVTRDQMTARRQYLEELMEARVQLAQQRANERIAELGPTVTRERASEIGGEELEGAIAAWRKQERQFWNFPKSVKVDATPAKGRFRSLWARTPKAQRGDFPEKAMEFLGGKKPIIRDVESVKELQGLRSEMLAEARRARSGDSPNYNRARIAEKIADDLLEVMGATKAPTSEVGQRLRTAMDFSKSLNDRFTRGAVGKLTGSEKGGGPRTEPGLTLEAKGGFKGPAGRAQYDALMRATEAATNVSSRQPAMQAAVSDYLKDAFQRTAMKAGQIDQAAAQRFLRDYGEVLGRVPELDQAFKEAITAGRIAGDLLKRQTNLVTNLAKPSVSKAAVFLGKEPGGEIGRVLGSAEPGAVAKEVFKQVRKDPTGEAATGLRSALVEHLLDKAWVPASKSAPGHYSGRVMLDMIGDTKMAAVMKEWLSGAQRARLKAIAGDARKVEMSINAGRSAEGIMGDKPGKAIAGASAVAGAAVGRWVSVILGGGTVQIPGKFSSMFQDIVKSGVVDPAKRIVVDAVVESPALFKSLLTRPPTEKLTATQREAERHMFAWLTAVTRDVVATGAGAGEGEDNLGGGAGDSERRDAMAEYRRRLRDRRSAPF